MKYGAGTAALAGVLCLIFAAVQATFERPPEAFLIAGVALIVVAMVGPRLARFIFGPSGVTIEQQQHQSAEVAKQVLDDDQAPDLKLAISHSYALGAVPLESRDGHVLSITAVNTGSKPIGIKSLGVRYTDGRWSPFFHAMPSPDNKPPPTILQPQETSTVYNDYSGFVESLRDEGGSMRPKELVAALNDGSERIAPVPEHIARLPKDE